MENFGTPLMGSLPNDKHIPVVCYFPGCTEKQVIKENNQLQTVCFFDFFLCKCYDLSHLYCKEHREINQCGGCYYDEDDALLITMWALGELEKEPEPWCYGYFTYSDIRELKPGKFQERLVKLLKRKKKEEEKLRLI